MPESSGKQLIYEKALSLGFDDCRVTTASAPDHAVKFEKWIAEGKHGEMGYLARNAHKRVNPDLVLPGAKSIISLASSYFKKEAPEPSDQPGAIARYAQYADYHDVLEPRLTELAQYIDQMGGANTRSLWYVDTGPLLERDIAQRAGLGFVGKHTNLISRKLGNWFFISEIITTLELAPDQNEVNRCGTCARCISACPTGAIKEPFHLDARLCISYLTIELKGSIPEELRSRIGNRIYGCDECLAVCPWNRFAKEAATLKPFYRGELTQQNLIELLSLDNEQFKRTFSGTPILRTKRRGILRNVCVALGNTAGETALPALEKAAADPEPLIAEHGLWAIKQIEQRIEKEAAAIAG